MDERQAFAHNEKSPGCVEYFDFYVRHPVSEAVTQQAADATVGYSCDANNDDDYRWTLQREPAPLPRTWWIF